MLVCNDVYIVFCFGITNLNRCFYVCVFSSCFFASVLRFFSFCSYCVGECNRISSIYHLPWHEVVLFSVVDICECERVRDVICTFIGLDCTQKTEPYRKIGKKPPNFGIGGFHSDNVWHPAFDWYCFIISKLLSCTIPYCSMSSICCERGLQRNTWLHIHNPNMPKTIRGAKNASGKSVECERLT